MILNCTYDVRKVYKSLLFRIETEDPHPGGHFTTKDAKNVAYYLSYNITCNIIHHVKVRKKNTKSVSSLLYSLSDK